MIPIAHRGLWWPHQDHQRTIDAAKAAAQFGYGVELDVCLIDGACRIQHHPHERPPNEQTPADYLQYTVHTDCLFFWDIKTDGLHEMLVDELATWGILHRSIIFDQDFFCPEAGFLSRDLDAGKRFKATARELTVCARATDHVTLSDALSKPWASGVWMDMIDRDWVTSRDISLVRDAGKKAFIVSPELHGRALDLAWWKEWNGADGVCTDFPHLLDTLLLGNGERQKLYPKDPWW